jgi:hypothetical protein
MVLHVTEAPLSLSGEKREKALAAFSESCMRNIRSMLHEAGKRVVSVSYVIDCGGEDDVVAKLHAPLLSWRHEIISTAWPLPQKFL